MLNEYRLIPKSLMWVIVFQNSFIIFEEPIDMKKHAIRAEQ